MQNHVILAFRKRLRKRGYTDISIFQVKHPLTRRFTGNYLVRAVEPLSGISVTRECSLEYMDHAFRF